MTAAADSVQDAARSPIADYAESLGITLLPWQRAYAEAVERGERPVMQMSKQAGRTTLRRVINGWHEQQQDAAQQLAEQAAEAALAETARRAIARWQGVLDHIEQKGD